VTIRTGGELMVSCIPNEAVEDKIALSDRFGLWLSFYPLLRNISSMWCVTGSECMPRRQVCAGSGMTTEKCAPLGAGAVTM
jgi:hypothetical protein